MQAFPKPLRLLPFLLLAACVNDHETLLTPKHQDAARKMTGLEQKFDLFDLNGDGYLSRKEMTEGLHSIGTPGVTKEKIDKIFEFYDVGGDGRISLREAQRGNEAGPDELLKMFRGG